MAKKKRKSAIRKTIITTILAMAVLISFSMQTYGATAQNIKISGKTYVYGFNINDSGRWTGKAYRQIKIYPLSSSKLKITYHYLSGSKKDETYTANKVKGYEYAYSPKVNHFGAGYKERISYYPKKGMVVYHGNEDGNSYILRSCHQRKKQLQKKLIKNLKRGSWWGKSFKYSIGIYDNYVLVGDTYGKLNGIYGIGTVKQTSYGYFIEIKGYNNYRWYKSSPNQLQCYSKASGSNGRKNTEDFRLFGC